MEKTSSISEQEMIKFSDILPGIISLLLRGPSVIKSLKSALGVSDEDRKSLGWVLEENARIYPDKNAILYEDVKLTHREFNKEFETTPTFKVKKSVLRNEGFDTGLIKEPLFVMLPGEKTYVPLTAGLYGEIENGKFRF